MQDTRKWDFRQWPVYSCFLLLGLFFGLLLSNRMWSILEYRIVPDEIVVQPPLSGTWCFPNTSLRGAETIRAALVGKLHNNSAAKSTDSTLIENTIRQLNDSTNSYNLKLLWTNRTHYKIVSCGSKVDDITLATEEEAFFLHQVPERFHEKYDSLADAYFKH